MKNPHKYNTRVALPKTTNLVKYLEQISAARHLTVLMGIKQHLTLEN